MSATCDIWLTYLCKFVARFSDGSKLEQAKDLFEQYLKHCQAKFAKNLYLLYAKLEEQHGLDRRALKIYERATNAVEPKEKEEVNHSFFVLIVVRRAYSHCFFFMYPYLFIAHLHKNRSRRLFCF